MSSGTISEKSNEQIQRKVQKCWLQAQKWLNGSQLFSESAP